MHPPGTPLKPMAQPVAQRASSSTSAAANHGLIVDGPDDARCLLLLAHGASQGPASPFMRQIASGLADTGVRVVRFRFPYMARMEADGLRRPPDREPVLLDALRVLVETQRAASDRLVIGGKSMGGRIASLIADDAGVDGLVCLGFPFHPPGKPERFRGEHLAHLRTPALICQGERDPFGRRDELEQVAFSPACTLAWIDDGEHSFKPRKASGRTWEENLALAVQRVSAFFATL